MLSRRDIIDFCGLTEAEVRAIAKHEGVSDMSAASLGQNLKHAQPVNDDGIDDGSLYEEFEEEDLQQALSDFKGSHFCPGSDVDE